LLTKEITRWTTQVYIIQRETIGCRPVYNPRQSEVCWKSVLLSVRFRNFLPEIILLSSTKQNIQVITILEWFRYSKTVIAFIWGEHQVFSPQEIMSPRAKALRENNNPRVNNFGCSPHMKENNYIIYTYGLTMMWISRIFNPSKVISPRALQLSMFIPYEGNKCILLYYDIRSVIVLCHKTHYCIVREEGLLHCVKASIIL